jgi:hypothetical protein
MKRTPVIGGLFHGNDVRGADRVGGRGSSADRRETAPRPGSETWITPGAARRHRLVVLSRHQTYEGSIAYLRCDDCGSLQIWLLAAGQLARRLKVIRGREQTPGHCPASE